MAKQKDTHSTPGEENPLAILILSIALIGGVVWMCNGSSSQSDISTTATADRPDVANKYDAFVMSQQFITDQLKAPSTAKFARSWSDGVHIEEIGDRWVVRAYVDAQNSFGAMIRTHYRCEMEYLGEKRWRSHGCSSLN